MKIHGWFTLPLIAADVGLEAKIKEKPRCWPGVCDSLSVSALQAFPALPVGRHSRGYI